jgi:formyltetrahydrofolate-dependent phosphoribosylglycinamide formyltransferase
VSSNPINLAILLSGSGTTLQNLIDEIGAGRLNATIRVVVSSRPDVMGVERARRAGLNTVVVDRKQFEDITAFSREVFRHVEAAGAELVCLAGWLSLLDVPPAYAGRVMNIHPALLPSFGGKGLFGQKVHQAVIDHGCKISGCTVHFLDATYDTGPIIVQRTCPVLEGDTAQALAARVFEQEKIAYPEAIRLFQQGRLRIDGRTVRVAAAPTRT